MESRLIITAAKSTSVSVPHRAQRPASHFAFSLPPPSSSQPSQRPTNITRNQGAKPKPPLTPDPQGSPPTIPITPPHNLDRGHTTIHIHDETAPTMPRRKSTSSITPADADADADDSIQLSPQAQTDQPVTATEQQLKARAEAGLSVEVRAHKHSLTQLSLANQLK